MDPRLPRQKNISAGHEENTEHDPPWVLSTLAAVLIITIVVDIVGNLLVIVSIFRNKRLRKAGGRRESDAVLYTCAGSVYIVASHVKDDERWRRQPPSQNLLDELAKTVKAQTPSRYAKKPETCILCPTAIQVEEWLRPTHKGMPNNPNTGGSHVPNGKLRDPENRKKNRYT
ncbi:hypothetical protein NDU88_006783 [Pleurodeles waltl]|uniref:Melatonin receptor type 1A n=1 Tax=Pleurodeles waltl TaxID=8319 RepID=A0AAV7PNE2_PLEWA|nr:hypothetical protein NDU88_006783 [Pleurodeles waltl]